VSAPPAIASTHRYGDVLAHGATRALCYAILALSAVVYGGLGLARYASFHNQTFDLALYARMAWGLSRGNFWDPVLGAHVLGLHLSPVFALLGVVGRAGDPAVVLIVAQALFLALAGWPLVRVGARRLGRVGALLGASSLLLYPNVVHVAAYEVHPGTLALLPLAWAAEAADRRDARAFALACVGVMCCREDLALPLSLLALLVHWKPGTRRYAWLAAATSLALFGIFLLVLAPQFAPANGSLSAHFGRWGGNIGEVLAAWITHPLDVARHLMAPRRLSYLPLLLLPLAFLPLLSWRWLVPALPALVINLLSDFPTTTQLDSHYLTPALPFLIVAALDGLARVARRAPKRRAWLALTLALVGSHLWLGGSPVSHDFEPASFEHSADSADASRILAAIPPGVSVQAPDALLPHLAGRPLLFRAADPDHGARFVVVDVRHRRRFAHQETLLRTLEEPGVRRWLAKDDRVLRLATDAYLLLERGVDPRQGAAFREALVDQALPPGARLTDCLELSEARAEGETLELLWRAHGPCPADLALRVDVRSPPVRVDLFLQGLFSPKHLRAGDTLRTRHAFSAPLPAQVYVGALRESGARPHPEDPSFVELPVTQRSTNAP